MKPMKHLKHMAIGGAVILGALVLFGVPLATAAQYTLLLACPLMMIGMMFFMNHGTSHPSDGHRHDHLDDPARATSTEPESTWRP